MTREEAIAWFKVLLKDKYAFNSADREAFEMAITALNNKTPCSLCRFIDDSDLCDICPAMPLVVQKSGNVF